MYKQSEELINDLDAVLVLNFDKEKLKKILYRRNNFFNNYMML